MAEKFMLITVAEREISTERFETLKDAQKRMHEEMFEAGDGMFDEDIFDDSVYRDLDEGEFGFNETSAWVSDGKNSDNYDWLIVEL